MVFREALQSSLVETPLFEQLRRSLDKIPLCCDPTVDHPSLLTSEQCVEEVAKLVKEGHDLAVFHQRGSVRGVARVREIADQNGLRDAHAGDSRPVVELGRMPVLVRAGMKIQVETAYEP